MVHRVGLAIPFALALASVAQAAEVTEVVHSEDSDSSVVFRLEPRYRFESETGVIAREQHCAAGDLNAQGQVRCATDSIVLNRELDYERVQHALDLDARLGLPGRLEFRVVVPIVFQDQTTMRYGEDVDETNSTVDPSDGRIAADFNDADPFFNTFRYFEVGDRNAFPSRSGLGDIRFGLTWEALNQRTNPNLASFVFGVDYVAPTGSVREGGSTGVGRGVHELQLRIAASREIGFAEPYFQASYALPLSAARGLFGRDSDTQQLIRPGQRVEFMGGVDFEIFEDEAAERSVHFGVGGHFGLQSEGRDYGPLFEGLAASECNGVTAAGTDAPAAGGPYEPDTSAITPQDAACGWVTQQPGLSANPDDPNAPFAHDGITAIDNYLFFGVHARLQAHFSPNVGMHADFRWSAQSNHLITGDRTGTDLDNDDVVNLDPSGNERNPQYNPTIDSTGKRFFLEGARNLQVNAGLFVQF